MDTFVLGDLKQRIAIVIALIVALSVLPGTIPAANAAGEDCESRNNRTYRMLTDCVTVEGVREHQQALQTIADANDGTRAEGTNGYTESVAYVVDTLTAAGWEAEAVPFEYPEQATVLEQLTPVVGDYDTGAFTGSGEG